MLYLGESLSPASKLWHVLTARVPVGGFQPILYYFIPTSGPVLQASSFLLRPFRPHQYHTLQLRSTPNLCNLIPCFLHQSCVGDPRSQPFSTPSARRLSTPLIAAAEHADCRAELSSQIPWRPTSFWRATPNESVHCLLATRSLAYNGARCPRESRCRSRSNTTFTATHNLHHAWVLRRRIIIYTCFSAVACNISSCSRKHTLPDANLHHVSKTSGEPPHTLASPALPPLKHLFVLWSYALDACLLEPVYSTS